MRPQAEAKSIQLHATLDADGPLARLDGDSISDAMRNLVDNAIKYWTAGTTVEIVLQMTDDTVEHAQASRARSDRALSPTLHVIRNA
jgi:two-component system phosphate regulon sensor histidine kinase PhoR